MRTGQALSLLLLLMGRVMGQDQAVIRLDLPTTTLTTGQYYDVAIRVENAPPFWTLDMQIAYDPALLYIMGTRAGSPVTNGDLFASESVGVMNRVERGTLRYIISKVGETAPVQGSGVIGSFRVYPLQAGTARLQFPQLQIIGLSSYAADAVDVTAQEVVLAPAMLDLKITGETVPPPDEATATPAPTATATPLARSNANAQVTPVPTLENIVFSTPTPPAMPAALGVATPDNTGLLIGGVVMIGLALAGIATLWIMRRRQKI